MLTILIPTIYGREAQFDSLCAELERQVDDLPKADRGKVQVRYLRDNKEMTIGAKRQALIEACETEHFVMVDDDDTLHGDYLKLVLEALKTNPDCVTYLEGITEGDTVVEIAYHSNNLQRWCDRSKEHKYHYGRTPYYKDVIRTAHAKQIGFSDMRYGEDEDFSYRLKKSGLIKTEVHLDEIMYYYFTPGALSKKEHKERYGIG